MAVMGCLLLGFSFEAVMYITYTYTFEAYKIYVSILDTVHLDPRVLLVTRNQAYRPARSSLSLVENAWPLGKGKRRSKSFRTKPLNQQIIRGCLRTQWLMEKEMRLQISLNQTHGRTKNSWFPDLEPMI
ncbi:hypothetical protein CEXT_397061 [Caerostris extrusa]|uniref:Uncharacterized protein n=1 Tax=Caerostris extrusa TaxID=172846 RepID=A0AAV4WB43_CAEEX|nr:hypothetical protein CEXT_397061 [Caerostris extrusa]